MTEAATLARPEPRVDHPAELDWLVRGIVRDVRPVAIYLFGSRARGDAEPESDYDLMVVVADDADLRAIHRTLSELAAAARIGAAPCITRAATFAWRRHEVGTLEHEVQVDGVRLWPPAGPDLRQGGPKPDKTMNVHIVEEWLLRVERDVRVAKLCVETDDPLPDQAAYHVQQAAEKLTKAALVAYRIRPHKGHKIEEFTALLPDDFPLRVRFQQLGRFSAYAWAHSYPGYPGQEEIPEPTAQEVRAWMAELAARKEDFEAWLAERAREAGR